MTIKLKTETEITDPLGMISDVMQEIIDGDGILLAMVYALPNPNKPGAGTLKIAELSLTCARAGEISRAFTEMREAIHARDCQPAIDRVRAMLEGTGVQVEAFNPNDPDLAEKIAKSLGADGEAAIAIARMLSGGVPDELAIENFDFSKLEGQ